MNIKTGRLAGRVAVVTAAGQGIGRATVERLAAEGAEVHASDINADLLATLVEATTTRLDATDGAAVTAYFSTFERVDILVHAVGYVHQGTIEECGPDDWRRSVNITLDSAYNVIAGAIPKMKARGGSIVTIGSVASSIKGFPRRAAYGAAKGGVIGLTKAVAADYVSLGIRCNSVCPGTVASPSLEERIGALAATLGSREEAHRAFISRQPAGRFGTVEEVAALCAFLASDEAAFITGQAINIDGGITI
ncbi:SDR family oxidoreductase [Shinella zoogloeoides]